MNPNKKQRAAIVGAGRIAREHLACLRQLDGVEIVGVCDLSRAVAESTAECLQVPAWYTEPQTMLEDAQPDVVHVTTSPHSHYAIALSALQSGAHVIVEKPATLEYKELEDLVRLSSERGRCLVENHNLVFDRSTRAILDLIGSGNFGDVMHVEVFLCLDIIRDSPFSDPNAPHPMLRTPGGAIGDFLTHFASLAYVFVGAHTSIRSIWVKRSPSPLPSDEFRALVACERGTAMLGFSANTQPDAFWLRVYGTKMQATANLFETRLTTQRLYQGFRPLIPFRNAMQEARDIRRAAFGTFLRKLNGSPGAYEGLWELLARTYRALATKTDAPVPTAQILSVNRLVAELTAAEFRI